VAAVGAIGAQYFLDSATQSTPHCLVERKEEEASLKERK